MKNHCTVDFRKGETIPGYRGPESSIASMMKEDSS